MVAGLPETADVALLLLLFSPRPQLLLRQRHLLLHVADLCLGPSTVLLEEKPHRGRGKTCFGCVNMLLQQSQEDE